MGVMKTPGVYIVEKNAFPNSVVEVATAVPAFIGYTEKADNKGKSLSNKPWRITSMSEFHGYFGFGPMPTFSIVEKAADSNEEFTLTAGGKEYLLKQEQGKYLLYYSLLLFYQNGGGSCYIVSVGNYMTDVEAEKLQKGIDLLVKEQEPTMVVIPDTMLLKPADAVSVQQATLAHCGGKMKNRVAILDVFEGYRSRQDPSGDPIEIFRTALGVNYLNYGMAYYPWLNTTIIQDRDLSYDNVVNKDVLQTLLKGELKLPDTVDPKTASSKTIQQKRAVDDIVDEKDPANKILLNKNLVAMSPLFNGILTEIKNKLNVLPPAAAMAGVYTMVDNSRGVWKAPANVSLNSVVAPTVNITHDDQEDLNVTTQGKSINALRVFIGEGTLVWGARTLDGNSLDWRYVNVRRTMIMLEESVKLATKAYVFEKNDANTWVTIKSMIGNFLTGIWKRGGLAGSSPDDAFSVQVGLGETMTPEDILEGILRVTVLVAISRPAEFIEITFQQQMQKS
ncbi:MAG: Phage tail sheath protein FI [Nitrospira sp.]|nr:Phage tail sheath protein FI [Nitrospira sp.]